VEEDRKMNSRQGDNPQVRKDLKDIYSQDNIGYLVDVDDKDILQWNVKFFGAPDSPFQGCYFKARVVFPTSYPNNPPTIKILPLTTENGGAHLFFHPNIYPNGDFCMSILVTDGQYYDSSYAREMWRPSQTASSVIRSMMEVMGNPNPDSAANIDAAKLYRDNPGKYYEKVDEYKIPSTHEASKDKIRIPATVADYQDPETYKLVEDDYLYSFSFEL